MPTIVVIRNEWIRGSNYALYESYIAYTFLKPLMRFNDIANKRIAAVCVGCDWVSGWDVRVSIENESGGFSAADTIKSEKKLTDLILPMFLHGATRCI